ncbi:unnamed protein product [marine sediment metagenome]|uniref:HD/PDEase domain-containing protein n=1 Tax=marine sediment metagenome TaxID=412755 RepID=X0U1E5_9ZZZZ
MKKLWVKDIESGAEVEGVFLVREANLRTARNGSQYIQADLADATGQVPARMWDANPEIFSKMTVGGFVRIRGRGETYRNRLQVIVGMLMPVDEAEVDMADFLPATSADVEGLAAELKEFIGSVGDSNLSSLLDAVFSDADFAERFKRSPAASSYHHAYLGGLLEHTVCVARLADAVADRYENLRRDLLVTGALLHDIGKVEELTVERGLDYTDAGLLVGHVVQGAMMLRRAAAGLADFPEEMLLLLEHLVLSHHGEFEFGSPKLPSIPEAVALHHIDNLDAKVQAFGKIISEDPNPDANWTDYSRMFERKLYKK